MPWTELMRLPGELARGPAPAATTWLALLAIPAWVAAAVALFWRRDMG